MNKKEFYTLLTNQGLAEIINAKVENRAVELKFVAIGSSKELPTQEQEGLRDEKHRMQINSKIVDENNPNYMILEAVIPSNIGGFELNEIAIFTKSGICFAVGNMPSTYKPNLDEGSAKDLTIKFVCAVDNASDITIIVDDTIVLSTREWVLNEISKSQEEQNRQIEEVYLKKSDIDLLPSVPVGIILAYSDEIAPDGYLSLNGATGLSRTVYANLFNKIKNWNLYDGNFNVTKTVEASGDGTTTFDLPDAEDIYLGGYGTYGVGTMQKDEFKAHTHTEIQPVQATAGIYGGSALQYQFGRQVINSGSTGGNETRPKTLRVNWIIKY